MNAIDAKGAHRKGKPSYAASFLTIFSLGCFCFLLGSIGRITSSASQLEDAPTASSITWISKKCKSAPSPLDVTTVSKQTVLVTGAASPTGYHVVSYCADVLGMKVIAVDEVEPPLNKHNNSTRFVKGNLQDESFVNDLFTWYQFNVVYHMADYGSSSTAGYRPASTYKANLVAAVHVLNGAIRTHVKTFVYLSSLAVYGPPGTTYTEAVSPDPIDPYGVAKAAMEKQVQLASRQYGISYVIIRAGAWFGPGTLLSPSAAGPLESLMMQAKKGKALIIPRGDTQTLTATYAKDMAPLIAESALMKSMVNEIINMGGERIVTYGEVTRMLAAAYDGDLSVGYARPQEAKAAAAKYMKADFTKMHCMFGMREETPLSQAINDTVTWLTNHQVEPGPAQQSTLQLELTSFQPAVAAQAGIEAASLR